MDSLSRVPTKVTCQPREEAVEYLYKSLVDLGQPTVEVLLDVLEIGHDSRIFPQPVSVFFKKDSQDRLEAVTCLSLLES